MQTEESNIIIQPAGPERLDDLQGLWLALYHHHAEFFLEGAKMLSPDESWQRRRAKYEAWLADPRNFLLVADYDGSPVGYAFVRIETIAPDLRAVDEMAELETISVLPEFRNKGLGTRLMQAVMGELAKRGQSNVLLGVQANNQAAIRFYERHGFSPGMLYMRNTVPGGKVDGA